MVDRFAGVSISRISAGIYLIQGNQVTMQADGDNNDQLKVRQGSSWLDFADYMAQVKARMDREAEEPEAMVSATLEDDSATKAAAATDAEDEAA